MRVVSRIRRSQIGVLLAVPAMVLMLAACASAGSSAETPAGSSAEAPAASTQAPLNDEEYSKAWDAFNLEVAQCLRDKGFDVKDPAPGGGFEEDLPGMREAGTDCYRELGGQPVSDAPKMTDAEFLDAMMKETECLRKKGYDLPDPTLQSGLGAPTVELDPADWDACRA